MSALDEQASVACLHGCLLLAYHDVQVSCPDVFGVTLPWSAVLAEVSKAAHMLFQRRRELSVLAQVLLGGFTYVLPRYSNFLWRSNLSVQAAFVEVIVLLKRRAAAASVGLKASAMHCASSFSH